MAVTAAARQGAQPLRAEHVSVVEVDIKLSDWLTDHEFAALLVAARRFNQLAHAAGLKVVCPSSPLDAYRLLRLAIADPDPVIVLEPKSRYWSKEEGELTAEGPGLGRARVLREGSACVLISYGAMVARCLDAAAGLEAEGISCTVLDLRSLSPLDLETLGGAVRAVGRAVVVHEAPLTLGLGAEVAARIMEEAFDHLEAPVRRVTGWDVPYPPASLEDVYLPSVERIARAVREVVAY